VQTDEDFPNLSGRYELSVPVEELPGLLPAYIAYSLEATRLLLEDEKAYEALEERTGNAFTALIESEAWRLVDEQGKEHKVLVPEFCPDQEIVWRWSI